MSLMNSLVMTSIATGRSLIGVSTRDPEIAFVAAYPLSLDVVTWNGSSWTAGAAELVDVVVVVVVVVVSGAVWAPSGRAVAAAMAARPERVRSKAVCLTGCIFIGCLGVEE